MVDITDKSHKPTLEEISDYVGNPLFDEMCAHMLEQYKALCSVEYSGDNVLLGWNVRFHKSGRSLCRLYPKQRYFTVLIVVGRKEKERAEALLPQMSDEMRGIYQNTQEGMGQRWLLIELETDGALYRDLLSLVEIRSQSR